MESQGLEKEPRGGTEFLLSRGCQCQKKRGKDEAERGGKKTGKKTKTGLGKKRKPTLLEKG